jgi:hypothetical protein
MSRRRRVLKTQEAVESLGDRNEKVRRSPLQVAREPLSLRFLLAFSASTVLTAAVAVPMAFQAHLARENDRAVRDRIPMVLGTTTVPGRPDSAIPSDGLLAASEPDGPRVSLDGAEVSGDVHLFLELPGVERVDFVIDDGPVVTDRSAPWQPVDDDSDTGLRVEPGERTLTATVTFTDGRVEARRAIFTVLER